ncbi:MAG: phosphoribosylglycinamide formyltransferase [Candidatus Aminicenantes bacterium]|nr:phosphoribosylglycinamide formyltransferase [Candidatus Aminicenantes bacterium]
MKKGRIAVLLSGRGSNFRALYKATKEGKIPAEIVLVITDKKNALGAASAREYGIETLYFRRKDYPDRVLFDMAIADAIEKRNIDLICLAGYMRILSPEFIKRFRGRIMNIHPALLPCFPGLHAQKQALDYGVRFSGATVHFVDEGVDSGPIILQSVVPVYQDDTEETLAERILKEEHRIYPEAVKLFFEGRLEIKGKKVIIKNEGDSS